MIKQIYKWCFPPSIDLFLYIGYNISFYLLAIIQDGVSNFDSEACRTIETVPKIQNAFIRYLILV